uniref:Glycosyl hydrolase family 95 N-terminal domain-containing protein n=1 Tax=Bionectria ochroleuca TaxID=29856 RepID=A0A8H7NR21_BIOOC
MTRERIFIRPPRHFSVMLVSLKTALAVVLLALIGATNAQQGAYYDSNRHLWYNTSGSSFSTGLVIGNGRMGAMVFGSAFDKVILNEASVWNGLFEDRTNPGSLAAFPKARDMLIDGNYTQAGQLVLRDMSSIPTTSRWFSVTNDLLLDFGHAEGSISQYERWLDTIKGNTGLNYHYNGVKYTREYIANFPTGVIAIRLTASEPGALSVNVTLDRSKGILGKHASTENNTVTLDVGGDGSDAVPFRAAVRAKLDGAIIHRVISTTSNSGLRIIGATTVDLFYDAETAFQWPSESLYKNEVQKKLQNAVSRGFPFIKDEAIEDHSSLTTRVELNLGPASTNAKLPTDYRIDSYRENQGADVGFITLAFNFGCHLLVSSSRNTGGPGLGVPANLQGIWNDRYNPPWGSKYTVNINTEMNYWLAEVTNLPDTLRPLWDLLWRSHDKGNSVAKKMYNCPGYVSHHNLDLWGTRRRMTTGPSGRCDRDFLKNTAWPLFKDAATFYDCYLFEFEGYLSTGPSISPENAFYIPSGSPDAGMQAAIDIGPTMDNSLLYDLYTNIIESSEALGIDLTKDPVLSKVKNNRSKLRPAAIGSKGQILEYRKEYGEPEPMHRHISHLWDLYPGSRMTPAIHQTLANAARRSLELRLAAGGAHTGWSRIWTAACFARLLDGNQTLYHIESLLKEHPMKNILQAISREGVFQIDSNFGLVAAVLAAGSVKGLVARGGFVVSMSWKDGKLLEAQITSTRGGKLAMKVANGQNFMIDGADVDDVTTTAGRTYNVTL